MEMVLKSPRFWFLVLLHVALWMVKKFQCPNPEECSTITPFKDVITGEFQVTFGGRKTVL